MTIKTIKIILSTSKATAFVLHAMNQVLMKLYYFFALLLNKKKDTYVYVLFAKFSNLYGPLRKYLSILKRL